MHRASTQAGQVAVAGVWALSCLLCGCSSAQPTLRISSPADGTVVHPGDSLKTTVEVSPAGTLPNVMLIGQDPIGLFPAVGNPPYHFVVLIPKTITPGPYRLTAAGSDKRIGPTLIESKPITLVVERVDEPVRLEVFPTSISSEPGRKWYLSVTGLFADGQKVDLKESTKTTYTSDTPRVATIDPKSIVNALTPGSAKITVSNGKAKVEIPIVVSVPHDR
jgi:Bacterial Ig-like domain (group 2)